MSSTRAVTMAGISPHIGKTLLSAYLLTYAVALFTMHRTGKFDVSEPLLILAVVGVGLSLAAWLLTASTVPLEYAMSKPQNELAAIMAYLVPLIVFVTWGLDLLHRHVPSGARNAFFVLLAKLLVCVIIPAAMMQVLFGYSFFRLMRLSLRARDLPAVLGMSALLLAVQAAFGHGLQDIRSAHINAWTLWLGVPVTFVWLTLEAGVVEEFFFRVLLQTRLSAVLKSELGGIVLTSVLFGLAHAPGLYLRTGLTQEGLSAHPSLSMAVGYAIVITSVAGFFFGVLWARTHNFIVIVVVHGFADLLPNFLPTLRSLHLLG